MNDTGFSHWLQAERAGPEGQRREDGRPQGQNPAQPGVWFTTAVPAGPN